MARNPYAGVGASTDPYANGSAPFLATDDYDPYGERYGTPPIPSASSSRERRQGRTGGYGGFYENSGGAPPAVQPVAQQMQSQDGYRSRTPEDPVPFQSPRRAMGGDQNNARRFREDRPDAEPIDAARNRDYRRGAERMYSNGNGSAGELVVGRSRGNGRIGNVGDGTRQIEGQLN